MKVPKERRICPAERDRIIYMLHTLPLPEIRERTGRSYKTIIRMAEALEKAQ